MKSRFFEADKYCIGCGLPQNESIHVVPDFCCGIQTSDGSELVQSTFQFSLSHWYVSINHFPIDGFSCVYIVGIAEGDCSVVVYLTCLWCLSCHWIKDLLTIGLSPKSGHVALHVLFLTSFYCDVTITHPFDGPFNCDVTMEKSVNRCDVGPLAIRQLTSWKRYKHGNIYI